ncbi:hypothetical protein MRX96_013641 [Rhipicephalus microplus]
MGRFKRQQEGRNAKDCTNDPVEHLGSRQQGNGSTLCANLSSRGDETIFFTISTGINFAMYDAVFVENLRHAKYVKPTPVHKYAVIIALAGRDLMACTQTGCGKTVSFVPANLILLLSYTGLDKPSSQPVRTPIALIASPTRELAI